LVHIRLKHNGITLRTDALVDSGATSTFIPIELAEVLEIERPSQTQEVIGAGGAFSSFICNLDLLEILKGVKVFCKFSNYEITVPVNPETIPYAILGRDSIFVHNDITFRERRQHTVFRIAKKQKNYKDTCY
jgi:predicted aspartyl protease